ncbi:MAG: endonuclease domain-containing protein [Acidiferrobacterales bacterium]
MAIRLKDLPPNVRNRVCKTSLPPSRRSRPRRGPTPHDLLWAEVSRRWPQAEREYLLIAGRRFRADIAFPDARLVVEVDGWQHHGRFLRDFRKDRERQNILTLAGWRILRIPAGDIRKDLQACCVLIAMAIKPPRRPRKKLSP